MKLLQLALGSALSIMALSANSQGHVTTYAESAGYSSCLSTVSDVETFFSEGQNYGSWAFTAKDKADDQILNSTLEITFTDGTHLIDFTVAPSRDGTCSYTYTRTWYSEKSCLATSKDAFMTEATYKTEINKNIAAFENGTVKILLAPAGGGCMVQQKEIGFRHKNQS